MYPFFTRRILSQSAMSEQQPPVRCNPSRHSSQGLKREMKSRSCENLLKKPDRQYPRARKYNEDRLYKGLSQQHFECPVEVQTQAPLSWEKVHKVIKEMEGEFLFRRKLIISGLPKDCDWEILTNFFDEIGCTAASKPKDGSIRVVFPSACKAKDSLSLINSTVLQSHKLSTCYGHPDSLLFVGNLPYTYTREDLINLFQSCGEILRCFIIHSPETGLSKGYGFVEFALREQAVLAKQQNATKVIGLRSLRVDFSDNGMQTCEDLHSQTLFVDRLPKGFTDEDRSLKEHFSQFGRVNFCQVALTPQTGVSRGFAFIDMSTSQEAERAQLTCNGGTFRGQEIRVSFGMPCRHGACILQHRSSGPPHNAVKVCPVGPPYGYQFQESMLHSLTLPYGDLMTRGYPFHELTNHSPTFGSLNHSVTSTLMRSISLTTLTQQEPQAPITRPGWGVAKSSSAPDMISPSQSQEDLENRPIVRKRSSHELDKTSGNNIYNSPFVGQHQQGIPFMHPLKRIRTDQE